MIRMKMKPFRPGEMDCARHSNAFAHSSFGTEADGSAAPSGSEWGAGNDNVNSFSKFMLQIMSDADFPSRAKRFCAFLSFKLSLRV
jgi:hypothetical protein